MKQMSYITRWLYSTSHKDIAILYLGYGLISSMVATGMSVIIRLELSGPDAQFLHGNNQVFNVLVTGHAIAMIFLFVMPVLIGAFGEKILNKNLRLNILKDIINDYQWFKHLCWVNQQLAYYNKFTISNIKQNIDNKNLSINKESEKININNIEYLGSYLAGLIEGNGSITVSDITSKNRYSPKIDIVFIEKDYQLALYLSNLLNIGKINKRPNNKDYIWNINKIEDTYKLLKLTNGYYRTPKYEAVVRAINWINNYILNYKQKDINNLGLYNMKIRNNILSKISIIDIKPLDTSNLWDNSWLSGFTDINGNFNIIISKRKNKNYTLQLSYKLEIKQIYLKSDYNYKNNNYFNIMSDISSIFNTNLNSRKRYLKLNNQNDYKYYYSYIIAIGSIINLKLVNKYFNKYPLLSSKYLDYKDWSSILNNIEYYNNKPSHPECIKLAIEIRKNYNSTRTKFNWDHLDKNI